MISDEKTGRANNEDLVERSTNSANVSTSIVDIELYKEAKRLAELKKVMGYSIVSVSEIYTHLCAFAEEERQN